jgi:hypothetical protein
MSKRRTHPAWASRVGADRTEGSFSRHHGVVSREAIAIDAELELRPDADPAGPGAEVTVELCGHWDHDGVCRWPHNSRIETDAFPARLRTIVVVSDDDREEIRRRIEAALRRDDRWRVVTFATTAVNDREQALARRLKKS